MLGKDLSSSGHAVSRGDEPNRGILLSASLSPKLTKIDSRPWTKNSKSLTKLLIDPETPQPAPSSPGQARQQQPPASAYNQPHYSQPAPAGPSNKWFRVENISPLQQDDPAHEQC